MPCVPHPWVERCSLSQLGAQAPLAPRYQEELETAWDGGTGIFWRKLVLEPRIHTGTVVISNLSLRALTGVGPFPIPQVLFEDCRGPVGT